MDTTTQPLGSIGIDIGKEVFHVVGFGADGKIAFRRKIKRLALAETFSNLCGRRIAVSHCGDHSHPGEPVGVFPVKRVHVFGRNPDLFTPCAATAKEREHVPTLTARPH
jgi:hypothetical protein